MVNWTSARSPFVWASIAAAIAALYRALVFTGFPNDQYMHLAWAQQVIRGELPGRDFVEPGMPLTIALSAAAQYLLGVGILSEFVLCTAFLAAAAGLTCWLATRLTGSLVLGFVAVALQLAMYPRPYNYPKIFIPVVAVLLIWRYVEHPGVRRAAIVGAWTAVGFLFRHDYLLYLGVAMLAAMVSVLPRCGVHPTARHLGAWIAAAVILILPYIVMLPFLGGVKAHFNDGLEFWRAERYQWTLNLPRLAVLPPPALPVREDLGPAGPIRRIARGVVLDGVLAVAPFVNQANAGVVIYYGAFLLPVAAIGAVAWAALRRRPRALLPGDAQVLTLAVLSLVLALAFVRHPFQARLADVAGTMPLVAVAAAARYRGTGLRLCGVALLTAAIVATCVQGRVWNRLYSAGMFSAPGGFVSGIQAVSATMQTWPWDRFWPQGPVPQSVYYLHACTAPDDYVLITWFAPEIFTFADRGFAAGHAFFTQAHFVSDDYQRAMIERLGYQRVPVALINLEQRSWFSTRFSILDGYINEHYTVVDTYRDYDGADIAVAVRKDLQPSGVFPPTGWSCFQ